MNAMRIIEHGQYELGVRDGELIIVDCRTGKRLTPSVQTAYQVGFDIQSRAVQSVFLDSGMSLSDLANEVNLYARETNAGGANWAASHR